MDEIQHYENLLRTLILEVMYSRYGSEFENHFGVTPERIQKWEEKIEEENRRFKGAITENRLLYFSDFYDLGKIINYNWDAFKNVFHEKKRFEIFFSEIEKFRNTKAHGRVLFEFQQSMINGILGDLKNLIIMYNNKNETTADYFLKILRVSDNLGNIYNSIENSFPSMNNNILRVGDELEFHVDAVDPKDRKIEYFIRVNGIPFTKKTDSNILKIKIIDDYIGKYLDIRIVALTEEEYDNSDGISFGYDVLPNKQTSSNKQ